MGIEIDFLPVGEESKSGDAIAFRYGNLHGSRSEQTVAVVDGGFSDNGEDLARLLADHYGTNHVDIAIVTHPDQDHVSGLKTLLDKVTIGELWMHLPWNHSSEMAVAQKSAYARERLSDIAKASLQGAQDLESIARAKGIPIVEPFTGLASRDGVVTIVGPSTSYYEEILPDVETYKGDAAIAAFLKAAVEATTSWLDESLHIETLTDLGGTSPINNTSAITLIKLGDDRYLLTGDAGMPALEQALDSMEADGFMAGAAKFVQVPHHGSRRNVGPTVLNRLLGEKGQSETHSVAFVSVAKNGAPKHPSKKVTNAFRRRGYDVKQTAGQAWRHQKDAPQRAGYSPGPSVPFHDKVEDDED